LKDLEDLEELGRGASGIVKKVVHRPSEKVLALKVEIDK
jgi:hypothetical protein